MGRPTKLQRSLAAQAESLQAGERGSAGRSVTIPGAAPIRKRAKYRHRPVYVSIPMSGLFQWLPDDSFLPSFFPFPFISVGPVPEESKCECGSSATGQPVHSTWCPLYAP